MKIYKFNLTEEGDNESVTTFSDNGVKSVTKTFIIYGKLPEGKDEIKKVLLSYIMSSDTFEITQVDYISYGFFLTKWNLDSNYTFNDFGNSLKFWQGEPSECYEFKFEFGKLKDFLHKY